MKKQSKRFGLPFKRKRQGRTDYRARLALLKSRKPRFVVRRSLKHVLVQIIEYAPQGDHVLLTITSKELQKNFGWDIATRNTPAAYLTGMLAGMKAKEKKLKEAILDLGLQKVTHGSLIFAVVKGANDAGFSVPFNPATLPKEDRMTGKHIKFKNASFDKVKAAILQSKPKPSK
ncbi:50S ribosomal protein L18 [Candidatus Woesearchaeota archaeon]|nr:50S ribosomal protein L18 [Candidatus Woesearchaeota archaeon]